MMGDPHGEGRNLKFEPKLQKHVNKTGVHGQDCQYKEATIGRMRLCKME